MHNFKYFLLVLISFVVFSTSAVAENTSIPLGTINFTTGSMAAGIGWTWGSGIMTFKGVKHKFTIKGLSVADVGITKADASGIVADMIELEDFNGTYVGVGSDVTIAGGAVGLVVQNEHGVKLKLDSTSVGVRFALGPEGLAINLDD